MGWTWALFESVPKLKDEGGSASIRHAPVPPLKVQFGGFALSQVPPVPGSNFTPLMAYPDTIALVPLALTIAGRSGKVTVID